MEFHRVLSRVAVGPSCHHGHALVNDPVFFVAECSQNQLPVRGMTEFSLTWGKNLFCDLDAVISAEPENADGADLVSCRNGGDGVRHSVFLQKLQRVPLGCDKVHEHIGAHNGHIFFP